MSQNNLLMTLNEVLKALAKICCSKSEISSLTRRKSLYIRKISQKTFSQTVSNFMQSLIVIFAEGWNLHLWSTTWFNCFITVSVDSLLIDKDFSNDRLSISFVANHERPKKDPRLQNHDILQRRAWFFGSRV